MTKKNFGKYLMWFGPFVVTAGLTIGFVWKNWGSIPLALVISGIAIIGLWLVWQSQESNWWGRRSTQAGTHALVATLAVLAILGLINFLGTRYHLRVDFTETHLFTIAPESRELVRSLKQPVKVWVFDVIQNPLDRELLENYRRENSKFQFEYVDPKARRGLVGKFSVKKQGEVYIESHDKRQLVQLVNDQEMLSEATLNNRLRQITSLTKLTVYFLEGHGEHPLTKGEDGISDAVQVLRERYYGTATLNLAQRSGVPRDATVVVVAGSKRALFDTELTALRDYLNQGGNLLLMIDPHTDPKLDGLLAEWGTKLDNRLVVDVAGIQELGPAVPVVTEYGKHPITKDFGNGMSFYPLARAVDTKPVPGMEATPLLLTKPYPKSWAESDETSEELVFHEGRDRKGPLTLGVALRRKLPPATVPQALPSSQPKPSSSLSSPNTAAIIPSPTISSQTKESRMVVLGNSDFATNDLFGQQLNGDVFLNSITWLSQQDQQLLSIRPKQVKNRRIYITPTQANLLVWSSVLILPLAGLTVASFMWWQRR